MPSDTTSPAASSTLRLSAQHGGAPMLCVKRRRVAGLLVGVVEGASHRHGGPQVPVHDRRDDIPAQYRADAHNRLGSQSPQAHKNPNAFFAR